MNTYRTALFLFALGCLSPHRLMGAETKEGAFLIHGHKIFYRLDRGDIISPPFVFVNGLPHDIRSWEATSQPLNHEGYTTLRIDLKGQGRTLTENAIPLSPIQVQNQSEDVFRILMKLGFHEAHFVGLSYGGGVILDFASRYPTHVKSMFLVSPYTEPVRTQDAWVKEQIRMTRTINPTLPFSDDQLYESFLRLLVYTTYPTAEPSLLSHPWKLEAALQLTSGIRHFHFEQVKDQLPTHTVNLIVGRKDQYISQDTFEDFWRKIPDDVKASNLLLDQADHYIPQKHPCFLASWIYRQVNLSPQTQFINFEGDPQSWSLRSQESSESLQKLKHCLY